MGRSCEASSCSRSRRVVACAVVWRVCGVAPAFAEGEAPWWHVVAQRAPTNLPPGGDGQVVVAATNLGDGEADGSAAPITVSDKLPPGIVAIGISGQVGTLGCGRGRAG